MAGFSRASTASPYRCQVECPGDAVRCGQSQLSAVWSCSELASAQQLTRWSGRYERGAVIAERTRQVAVGVSAAQLIHLHLGLVLSCGQGLSQSEVCEECSALCWRATGVPVPLRA